MSFSLDLSNTTRALANLNTFDIIEYESEFIQLNTFMVLSADKDDEIPALLLQLWRFEGGYNHAISNVMQNDLGLNLQVPYFEPEKKTGRIKEIVSYRSTESGLSKKEEYFFDLVAHETSNKQSEEFSVPYEVLVEINQEERVLIVPEWTPVQKLPLDRVHVGTTVEIWTANSISTIVKVIQV